MLACASRLNQVVNTGDADVRACKPANAGCVFRCTRLFTFVELAMQECLVRKSLVMLTWSAASLCPNVIKLPPASLKP